ncbi:MAG: amidase, partial [Comamonadaceae bacterium]|nr:amidase [Comamonadaceae bacterium]
MKALHELGARELAAHYASGALSPVEVARAVIARIERWEPRLHALWAFAPEAVLAQAQACEARWRAGRPLSALDGVPLTL